MKKVNEENLIKALRFQALKESSTSAFKEKLLKDIKKEKFKQKNFLMEFLTNIQSSKQVAVAFSLLILFFIGGISYSFYNSYNTRNHSALINDWEYYPNNAFENSGIINRYQGPNFFNIANIIPNQRNFDSEPRTRVKDELGYSVGGAKDISNFRDNIKKGYLPSPSDISTEGIFYDYYFDTNKQLKCEKLFCPTYSTALSRDKYSGVYQPYITIGLNSGLKESDLQRPNLNLMIVLDISGSMSSTFNSYYYDRYGNKKDSEYSLKTKLEIAKEVIIDITKKLKDGDSLGIILFDNEAYVAKQMREIKVTDMNAIRTEIAKLQPQGGTNMEKGLKKGKRLLEDFINSNKKDGNYENRVFFLTDAMPNQGNISDESLKSITEEMSKKKIYSTFVGIGVDFNTELVQKISNIKGANYFSVNSESEFKKTISEDFDLIVTPLVFDLNLKFNSSYYEVAEVFGIPSIDKNNASQGFINIKTLFPSRSSNGETRGGVILLKLKETKIPAVCQTVANCTNGVTNGIYLEASYQKRNEGYEKDSLSIASQEFYFGEPGVNYFIEPFGYENNGIRKAVLISNYTKLMQSWLIDANKNQVILQEDELFNSEYGLRKREINSSKWERTSKPLKVSDEYKKLFSEFKIYFEQEMKAIGDESLKKEIEIMDKLINS